MTKKYFRGELPTGKYIYGYYVKDYLGQDKIFVNRKDMCQTVPVKIKAGSACQYVGEARKGRDVYEGDALRNPRDGTRFKAAMNHINTIGQYELEGTE